MVFSQSTLKVVELDRLKPEKTRQVFGSTGVITGGKSSAMPHSPAPTTSFSEVYLKSEPFESTMFHDSDYEFFQDLAPLCSDLGKDGQVQTIDSLKETDESAHNTDTLHTPYPATGWGALDAISPAQSGFYISTPTDQLSPTIDGFAPLDSKFLYTSDEKKIVQELDFDLSTLPVVVEQLASEQTVDLNSAYVAGAADYTPNTINTHKILFFDFDNDIKLDTVKPTEVENNLILPELITHNTINDWEELTTMKKPKFDRQGLSLNVNMAAPWGSVDISTPDVLQTVEQLEKQEYNVVNINQPEKPSVQDSGFLSIDNSTNISIPVAEYDTISLKAESHGESDVDEDSKPHVGHRRKRRDSEDSDETYTPYNDYTPPKRKKRNIPIKELITALEGSQTQPKRRGRPPKRRVSTLSSCSIDDNASNVSTHENKYRELRDKNNEASKRSRMNRKLKELQMEQLVLDLEERNKKLKVKADILEDMTKRLKDSLMTAILQK